MKRLLTILLSAVIFLSPSGAPEASPGVHSDRDAMSTALHEALDSLIGDSAAFDGKTAYLEITGPIKLTPDARHTVEAYITGKGAVLSDEPARANMRLTVSPTDASVILTPSEGGFTRTVSITLHVVLTDGNGSIVNADGTTYTNTTHIPNDDIEATDDVSRFSGSIARTVIAPDRTIIMSVSLLIITSALAYFAFHY